MTFDDFLEKVVDAADEVYGEDGIRNHDVDYTDQAMEIMSWIVPATSYHVVEAAIIKYKQTHGLPVPDYSPAPGIEE